MARYRILAELGRGGMGIVHRVLQVDLQREVAMKVMLGAKELDASSLRRFEHEIEAMIQLEHPHIVRLFDQGSTDGNPWFTMELIPGRTFHDVIEKEAPLTPRRVASILTQVLDALEYCHGRGLIHRDIKPRNLMLCDQDHTVLMDFGLVKDPGRTALTESGTLVGTPHYMAPETVVEGLHLPESDIYSLGMVMYELATGVSPIPHHVPITALAAMIAGLPAPPIRRDIPDFPAPLEACLLSMLEKEPERRPGAAQLRRALTELDLSVRLERPAPPPRPTGRSSSSSTGPGKREGRGPPALGLGLGLVGVAFVIFGTSEGTRTAPPAPATSGPTPPASSPARDLDVREEVVQLVALSSRIENSIHLSDRDDDKVLQKLRELGSVGANLPRLHEAVARLDRLLARALAPDAPSGPRLLPLIHAVEKVLGDVQDFYTYQARSRALHDRVKKLHTRLDPAEKDPFRRGIGLVLLAHTDLALEPSIDGHARVGAALIACFDLIRDEAPDWRRTPEGVRTRTSLVEDACLRIQRSYISQEGDHLDEIRVHRLRLLAVLPDLLAALETWNLDHEAYQPAIASQLRAMALKIGLPGTDDSEARSLIQSAQQILDRIGDRPWDEDEALIVTRQSEILRERARLLGAPFRTPPIHGTGRVPR